MRRLNVNFRKLILQLLPPHKRQPVRLLLLQSLVDLSPVYDCFSGYWSDRLRLINMDSRKKVLEGYLRSVIHPEATILTYTETLVLISLLEEEQLIPIGLEEENPVLFPLQGEETNRLDGFDFAVIVPAGTDVEKTAIEVDKFNAIDKKYTIIIQ